MLFDVPIHELSAGGRSLLQDSRNKSGASSSSSAHLRCNLQVRRGGRHLLLGKNGCGKTTLLQAVQHGLPGVDTRLRSFLVDQELALLDLSQTSLEAVLSSDAERCALQRRCRELERLLEAQGDAPSLERLSLELSAVYEDLARGEDEAVREQRARGLLESLGFSCASMQRRLGELSGGWRMRAAIAVGLFSEPDLLMLDEPTNHLDMQAALWLQSHLVEHYSGEKTLLCVTHDRSFINAVMTEIIVFQDGSLVRYAGSLEDFENAAEEMAKHMEREAEVLEKKRAAADVAIQKHAAREQRSMKNKASNMLNRSKDPWYGGLYGSAQSSKVSALNRKLERVGMEKTLDGKRFKASEHGFRLGSLDDNEGEGTERALAAAPLFQKRDPALCFGFSEADNLGVLAGMPVLQVQDADFQFQGERNPILADINLSISSNSRIAIVGANGAGKTTLVNLLTGALEPTSGHVSRHRNLKIAHVSQHDATQLQASELTALEYMMDCLPGKSEPQLRALLGAFGVRGSMANQALSSLSGGQRMRVIFAKSSAERPHVLVLDEPTNHLDIYSIDALADALKRFQGAVVLVSHDRSLIQDVAERVVLVHGGSCTAFEGGGQSTTSWESRMTALVSCAPCQASVGAAGRMPVAPHRHEKSALPCHPSASGTAPVNGAEIDDGRRAEQKALRALPRVPRADLRHVATPLRAAEKEFLRCIKRVREIHKLEDLKSSGHLSKLQDEKLQRKGEAVNELADVLQYLPGDSEFRERNQDLLRAVFGDAEALAYETALGSAAKTLPRGSAHDMTQGTVALELGLELHARVGEEEVPPGTDGCRTRGKPPGTGNRQTQRRREQRRAAIGRPTAVQAEQ